MSGKNNVEIMPLKSFGFWVFDLHIFLGAEEDGGMGPTGVEESSKGIDIAIKKVANCLLVLLLSARRRAPYHFPGI